MSRSGHYSGGSTLIGPGNKSWFGQKEQRWEKNANDRRSEEKLRKLKAAAKKLPKPLPPSPKLPGIKAQESAVNRSVVEVCQGAVRGKGGRGAIAVEYGTVRGRPTR
ncbi:hypothetical protein [Bradyrhizobium sp. McL0616]|uniref:hypothetical protein n=1 Tax=Bradyrhizobium sp. McL0616 TaxID=3415674 RepID=UPI003CF5A928